MSKWSTPQSYHGIGCNPVPGNDWERMCRSDYWLRKPLLQEHRMRKRLRLIVNKHVGRLEAA